MPSRRAPGPELKPVRVSSPVDLTKKVLLPGSVDEGIGDRLARYAGTPVGLALLVLVLVVASGFGSTISTYRSLRRAGEQHSAALLRERAEGAEVAIGQAFAVADPILDRLGAALGTAPHSEATLLVTMAQLAAERRGLSWVSVSFPDGRFVGIRVVEDEPIGTVSTVDPPIERTLRIGPRGKFEDVGTTASTYDPRVRSFYRLALARPGRSWTDPYPFLPDLTTGITRTEALRDGAALVAVLTVDFDAGTLGHVLGPASPGERLVLTVDDAVLAVAGATPPPLATRNRERPLRTADFTDAAVRALGGRGLGADATLNVDDTTYLHRRLPVTRLDEHPIVLHALVPETRLFARARSEAWAGAGRTTALSFVALAFGLLLSQRIAKLRRSRDQAVAEAAAARAEADELGAYALLEPIGKGGMGTVYRARHKLLARDAALKLVQRGDGRADDQARKRFFEEARLLSQMRSIHTVAVYDFGVAGDGRYFLAMELLEGLDLDALVRTHGPVPGARVAALLAQACDSLAEAHAAGLVHQDIKPANLFLCRLAEQLDVVKVLDFGLTRAVGKRRSDGLAEGTPAFMSPEQARGEAVGPSSDLYAIGCVAFFLLSGRYPYDADSSEEYMKAHVSASIPELPRMVRDALPPPFVHLLTRCLAKNPDKRPISARALASALRSIVFEGDHAYSEEEQRLFWQRWQRSSPAVDPSTGGAKTLLDADVAPTNIVRRASVA